jgi:protoporphyrinogen oxidase
MNEKRAIIIGAGPAGLTAAYELVHKTKIRPIIYEMSGNSDGSTFCPYREHLQEMT